MKSTIKTILLALALSCPPAQAQSAAGDPLQGVNRAVFKFNLTVDRFTLKPAAKLYAKLPRFARTGVGNFFSNLGEPVTAINDILQGKFAHAARDTGRFLVNSTVGIGGLFDVAQHFKMPKRREDFGQTLAVWGVPPGPYLMLPILGPRNLRDAVNLAPQYASDSPVLSPLSELESPASGYATGLRALDGRSRLLELDGVLALQPDQYVFLRESYRQRRELLIRDGTDAEAAADEADEDELLDELLEE